MSLDEIIYTGNPFIFIYIYAFLCYFMNKKKGNGFLVLNGVCDSYIILRKTNINCRPVSFSSNCLVMFQVWLQWLVLCELSSHRYKLLKQSPRQVFNTNLLIMSLPTFLRIITSSLGKSTVHPLEVGNDFQFSH